ncbi:OmpW family protein [Caulobacter sp. UNC279MFTsu5.1]|uniref:OmpW/AlkL family protein n=1 Tax=Caulobacter sp. UNC279MFTsu5.1 TaxID=1502775 RepID=UPI0008F0AE14|nr:OmpW family outer membrane protein [Caulobacter sp. UNC279MFTsu5.1]SFK58885.1 outer membrane protein [Caulobacter sp. UNC279MFTsu5.1]
MTTAIRSALALAAAGLFAASTAHAQEAFAPKAKGTWMLNVRATEVSPDAGDPIVTSAGAATGLRAEVSDDVMPTIGLSYFLTDKIAVEVIAGTTQHTVKAVGPGTDVEVHKTWVLPPVVSVQYHPYPAARFSPYVGAGLNYMLFYSDKDKNGFKVKLDDGFGYALQAGADVALTGRYSLNVDVKKVWFETDASINDGALKSKVNLDPWVVSAGVGYRF